jgi:hypothetical protein
MRAQSAFYARRHTGTLRHLPIVALDPLEHRRRLEQRRARIAAPAAADARLRIHRHFSSRDVDGQLAASHRHVPTQAYVAQQISAPQNHGNGRYPQTPQDMLKRSSYRRLCEI